MIPQHWPDLGARDIRLPDTLIYILLFIAAVVIYSAAKVLQYVRQSEQQWKEVDKSKLREWEDDEEW